jgi:hypothetical protein
MSIWDNLREDKHEEALRRFDVAINIGNAYIGWEVDDDEVF